MTSLFQTIEQLASQENCDALLEQFHLDTAESLVDGRNILAGYARGGGLIFGGLRSHLEKDPVYQESLLLADKRTYLSHEALANIFLLMKYGMKDKEGAIIDCGCYRGGSALFMANIAGRLNMPITIYALDTFQGIPEEDERLDLYGKGCFAEAHFEQFVEQIQKENWNHLIPVQGPLQKTLPVILPNIKKIVLAHLDCLTYAATKSAWTTLEPLMHPMGGYFVIEHAIHSSSSPGVFQAMEEMVQARKLHAEQAAPHFVFRIFNSKK